MEENKIVKMLLIMEDGTHESYDEFIAYGFDSKTVTCVTHNVTDIHILGTASDLLNIVEKHNESEEI